MPCDACNQVVGLSGFRSKVASVEDMSRTQDDRLGERLRLSDPPSPEDLDAFDSYRAGFAPALLGVVSRCAEP
jgi:hypothetical protein